MTQAQPVVDEVPPARRAVPAMYLDPLRARKSPISVRRLLEHTAGHDGSGSNTAQRLAVENVMATLSPRERACVVLRYCEDKSPSEIGQALGIGDDAVKKHLSTAVRRLASVLGPLPERQIEPIAGSQEQDAL